MGYLDGVVIPVSLAKRDAYTASARLMAEVFVEHGALEVVDGWGEDVPDGEVTSFPMAVRKSDDEAVAFGWVLWPDKATRDDAWPRIMEDPRMAGFPGELFDGKRMIFGGFDIVQTTRKGGR